MGSTGGIRPRLGLLTGGQGRGGPLAGRRPSAVRVSTEACVGFSSSSARPAVSVLATDPVGNSSDCPCAPAERVFVPALSSRDLAVFLSAERVAEAAATWSLTAGSGFVSDFTTSPASTCVSVAGEAWSWSAADSGPVVAM